MTDPIADFLTRIRNALAISKESISLPYSGIKHHLAQTLLQQGYLDKVSVDKTAKPQAILNLTLKYVDGHPVITKVARVSKPGRRNYIQAKDIKPILSGYGHLILSTSQGIMTGQEARKKNLGGEVICQIW